MQFNRQVADAAHISNRAVAQARETEGHALATNEQRFSPNLKQVVAADVFGDGHGMAEAAPAVDVKALHAKIGQLTLENDFLEGALTKAGLLSAKR